MENLVIMNKTAKQPQVISAFNNAVVCEDLETIYQSFTERKRLKDSTIVITGCAGFLGFYLMHFFALFAEDIGIKKIIGLDNFQLGRPDWIDQLVKAKPGVFDIHSFNITDGSLNDIPSAADAGYVLHMASIASPIFYRKFPIETLDANIWGLRKLLDFYKKKRLKGFLFFSSSEIYGDPSADQIPTNEAYRGNVASMGPRACYDEAKRFGETLCYLYAGQFELPITIVRPFNNYGPGMKLDDQRVPADFAKAILENKDIVILSDGAPTRTFCYLTDAVAGYLKVLVHDKFDYFNIGMDRPEISIRQLGDIYAQQGKALAGYKGKVIFQQSGEKDYLTDNPNRRCPDISKARTILGFNPVVEVNEGVGRFLQYHLHERASLS